MVGLEADHALDEPPGGVAGIGHPGDEVVALGPVGVSEPLEATERVESPVPPGPPSASSGPVGPGIGVNVEARPPLVGTRSSVESPLTGVPTTNPIRLPG